MLKDEGHSASHPSRRTIGPPFVTWPHRGMCPTQRKIPEDCFKTWDLAHCGTTFSLEGVEKGKFTHDHSGPVKSPGKINGRACSWSGTCAKKALIRWMLWTWSVHFKPFINAPLVVYAEAGQARDGVPLCELLQADGTLPCILRQDVLVVCDSRLC